MRPIYKPKGRAGEYGDYAINIYTGCTHGCTYCYARDMAKRFGTADGWRDVKPREGVVEAVKKQLIGMEGAGKLIHLCFTCDPYPAFVDTTPTREIIKEIKESGNHVQILTKSGETATRNFDLMDENDWFGITISGADRKTEPYAADTFINVAALMKAHSLGIKTWVSFEPVIEPRAVLNWIKQTCFADKIKIGKLNHRKSDVDWKAFGKECESLCQKLCLNYYIKDDLRKEMES
ncbi:MAG: DUF5131 family protein [Eubacteriales bacterium]|nr:DUF5131 family protein [Eubacteriales bacterium]